MHYYSNGSTKMKTLDREVVWIVDDEVELAKAYSEYLSDRYEPKIFHSVESALAEFDHGGSQPKLIVSDLKMPKKGGIDLLRELRERNREIPAIIISGHADKTDIAEAASYDISGFLEKPFELMILEEMIQHTLDTRSEATRSASLNRIYRKLAGEIIRAYEKRYVAAENALFALGVSYPESIEEKRRYIENLTRERLLSNEIEEIEVKLNASTQKNNLGRLLESLKDRT